MIEKFISYKEPKPFISDGKEIGIIFRTRVLMTDGRYLVISDAQHSEGLRKIDETLVFPCDEEGNVTEWIEIAGGREVRTDEVIKILNSDQYC